MVLTISSVGILTERPRRDGRHLLVAAPLDEGEYGKRVKPVVERRGLTLPPCCFLLPAVEFQVWLSPYQRGLRGNGMVLAVVLCKHLVPSPRGYTFLSQMSPDSTVL